VEVRNLLPFPATFTVYLDRKGAEQLVVATKATYAISDRGELQIAGEQDPFHLAEEFFGDPTATSIRHEAELGPPKLTTDAFLVGSAVATDGQGSPRPAPHVEVRFRIGDREKVAMVIGNRYWVRSAGGVTFTDAEPFDAMPLMWENSFGGTDLTPSDSVHHSSEPRNPVGRGFRARHSQAEWEGVPLPNIENPSDYLRSLGQVVEPIGFGPVGRSWQPRVQYAGTYDERWIAEKMPLLPEDFDDRFHNAAPPDMVLPAYVAPGDWVDVVGCTTSGRVYFQLPDVRPAARVTVANDTRDMQMNCETVTVDTNRMLLTLLFKGAMRVHREVPRLRRTTIFQEGTA
jgi:hypothetical protein